MNKIWMLNGAEMDKIMEGNEEMTDNMLLLMYLLDIHFVDLTVIFLCLSDT